ncbi:MAG: DNA recombination protein RmuC [Eubacterium sp.]|nr:DNA recombination protein RmuC [Eubacterium sp.]
MLTEILSVISVILLTGVLILLVVLIKRPTATGDGGDMRMLSDQIHREVGGVESKMNELTNKNYEQQIALINTLNENSEKQTQAVSKAINDMQTSNEKKLDQMRSTVDEKLTDTLDKRLNASFETVSKQLENVYKSLGDMQRMSADVTSSVSGLNRILTNVKARGTWAEVQLKNILDQTIPGMYEENVQTNKSHNGRVEFAIKIPDTDSGAFTYLPLDSKFPIEDYARLTAAADAGNAEGMEAARKALEARVRDEGKMIKKYISLPDTTPFAIMYLATEGLYAEIVSSRSGLAERLQQDGILIAGPSTITALLNSLAMGFRTLAINQKANEVWKILGVAKGQYEKFAEQLETARKRIKSAGEALDEADKRNNIIQKRLKNIETLDDTEGMLEE